jgi:hypothetical protein
LDGDGTVVSLRRSHFEFITDDHDHHDFDVNSETTAPNSPSALNNLNEVGPPTMEELTTCLKPSFKFNTSLGKSLKRRLNVETAEEARRLVSTLLRTLSPSQKSSDLTSTFQTNSMTNQQVHSQQSVATLSALPEPPSIVTDANHLSSLQFQPYLNNHLPFPPHSVDLCPMTPNNSFGPSSISDFVPSQPFNVEDWLNCSNLPSIDDLLHIQNANSKFQVTVPELASLPVSEYVPSPASGAASERIPAPAESVHPSDESAPGPASLPVSVSVPAPEVTEPIISNLLAAAQNSNFDQIESILVSNSNVQLEIISDSISDSIEVFQPVSTSNVSQLHSIDSSSQPVVQSSVEDTFKFVKINNVAVSEADCLSPDVRRTQSRRWCDMDVSIDSFDNRHQQIRDQQLNSYFTKLKLENYLSSPQVINVDEQNGHFAPSTPLTNVSNVENPISAMSPETETLTPCTTSADNNESVDDSSSSRNNSPMPKLSVKRKLKFVLSPFKLHGKYQAMVSKARRRKMKNREQESNCVSEPIIESIDETDKENTVAVCDELPTENQRSVNSSPATLSNEIVCVANHFSPIQISPIAAVTHICNVLPAHLQSPARVPRSQIEFMF